MQVRALGATGNVTGSCYVVDCGRHTLLMECGLFQGGREEEARNWDPLEVELEKVDAIILSHAHIDHSGRLPLLIRSGYSGPIYTHHASKALCDIMLQDSAFLQERDAEWENKRRKNKRLIEPLYNREDAAATIEQIQGVGYGEVQEILPGVRLRFVDAGHILGSAIVELWHDEGAESTKLVFSGDLGYQNSPLLPDPEVVDEADLVLMESTYGDRLHRSFEATLEELGEVFERGNSARGNILIPAFAVGRTQDLLFLLSEHYDEWGIGNWTIFVDSPMAIETTEVYAHFHHLYDEPLFNRRGEIPTLPNLYLTRTTDESIAINRVKSGAIIIAGSGMCTGGRIRHHIRQNISRAECQLVIIGFQAEGTLGRLLVDGVQQIKMWGELYPVRAAVHTIGGLSAHADQEGLLAWYGRFQNHPPVALVHGEDQARRDLQAALKKAYGVQAKLPQLGEILNVYPAGARKPSSSPPG